MQEASSLRAAGGRRNQKSFEELKASGKMEIYTLTEEDREKFVAAAVGLRFAHVIARNTSKQLKVAIIALQGTFSRMCRNASFFISPDLSVD